MSNALLTAYRKVIIKGPQKAVLNALCDLANDDGASWSAHGSLAVQTGFSLATVKRYLAALEAGRYIARSGYDDKLGTIRYRVLTPGEVSASGGRVEQSERRCRGRPPRAPAEIEKVAHTELRFQERVAPSGENLGHSGENSAHSELGVSSQRATKHHRSYKESTEKRENARTPASGGSLLPDGWKLSPELRAWSSELCGEHAIEDRLSITEKFTAHHRAHGSIRHDWDAAWRKWLLDEVAHNAATSRRSVTDTRGGSPASQRRMTK